MAVLSTSFTIWASFGATILFDIRTSPTDYAIVRQFEVSLGVSTFVSNGVSFGIAKPSVLGTANQNGIRWLNEEGVDVVPNITIGTDWPIMPAAPTTYIRRFIMSDTVVCPYINIPMNVKIAPSSSLGLFLISGIVNPSRANRPLNVNLVINS